MVHGVLGLEKDFGVSILTAASRVRAKNRDTTDQNLGGETLKMLGRHDVSSLLRTTAAVFVREINTTAAGQQQRRKRRRQRRWQRRRYREFEKAAAECGVYRVPGLHVCSNNIQNVNVLARRHSSVCDKKRKQTSSIGLEKATS